MTSSRRWQNVAVRDESGVSGPHPAVAACRVAVRDALGDLELGTRVWVACSGGPDSLALAAAAAYVGRKHG